MVHFDAHLRYSNILILKFCCPPGEGSGEGAVPSQKIFDYSNNAMNIVTLVG